MRYHPHGGFGESFEQVLAAARLGADWAWSALYRQLAPLVAGYLRGRGAPDPDDLTGEVFVSVVRNLPRFSGDERSFRTWVLTIAHRRLLDAVRQGSRRVSEVPFDDLDAPGAPRGDAEEQALERLGSREVVEVLSRLSSDQQSVLLLRIVGDLTVEEVASVLGKRPGAIKALQRRGLARLRKDLSAGPRTPRGDLDDYPL